MRLSTERELASALGVSRATVTAAYDLLRESRYAHSRQGRRHLDPAPRWAGPHQIGVGRRRSCNSGNTRRLNRPRGWRSRPCAASSANRTRSGPATPYGRRGGGAPPDRRAVVG
ncbi:GntR family transcriptional regulator [Streptomyces olivaceoviridis]